MSQRDQDKHKARQQRLKEVVDAKVAEAQVERGLVLVLTGNGKGKSTAGFGTVLRAVGHGLNCTVAQFIKGEWPCGERNVLEKLGVPFHIMKTGFTWNTQDREGDTRAAEAVWAAVAQDLANPAVDMVLLDELTYMLSLHYLDVDTVVAAIEARPEHQHVVITGRNCHRRLLELADTVSEIAPVKHAFDAGIKAQQGLDW
ncbi:cob(I)yrinic acid a,c-diamide adenosyltransferase [Ferrimonas balearica]|uniref:cob(I)yrinic acid a,c-diamide adenosyltransferase n=1 Tax=Ferrimonas balearica TaxID=44012 RepID=UPI001C5A0EDE|nr:cob(I)yrinic acid a,c-diamide adenosyltransferase [Ferrimonas balearica]MBW3164816.1 cob(I)yrinic acid a,c-diamide adenosyltransferase [Ferrimonas balearica]